MADMLKMTFSEMDDLREAFVQMASNLEQAKTGAMTLLSDIQSEMETTWTSKIKYSRVRASTAALVVDDVVSAIGGSWQGDRYEVFAEDIYPTAQSCMQGIKGNLENFELSISGAYQNLSDEITPLFDKLEKGKGDCEEIAEWIQNYINEHKGVETSGISQRNGHNVNIFNSLFTSVAASALEKVSNSDQETIETVTEAENVTSMSEDVTDSANTGTVDASTDIAIDEVDTTDTATTSDNGAVQLDVVSYKQYEGEWANDQLGNGSKTFKNSGCTVTSMAMLYSYTTGTEVTPLEMESMLSFSGSSVVWSSIENLGYTVDSSYEGQTISNSSLSTILSKLQEGKAVEIGAKTGSGSQHYVVITGYNGDGANLSVSDFTINDPGSSTRTTLAEYLEKYPNLYKLIYAS